jgi:hypothetical protein
MDRITLTSEVSVSHGKDDQQTNVSLFMIDR